MQKRGGGYHDFPSENFCLTVTKLFIEEPFSVAENFGYRNILWIRERGHQDFPLIIFLSRSTETFHRGTLRCCRKFRVSKNFMPKRGDHDFAWKNICPTVPKNLKGEPFCVSEKLWYRKFSCIRRGCLLINLKNVVEPAPTASEPCCPIHCAMGTIEISDKCQWNHKKLRPDKDLNLDLLLEKCFPHRTAETVYSEVKIVSRSTLIKKKYDLTKLNKQFFLHM